MASNESDLYPGFPYPAGRVKRFAQSNQFFTLLIKDADVLHYEPDDADAFRQWLIAHRVPDAKASQRLDGLGNIH